MLHGESKYYDVLERTLYNGLISGVSLDGGSFFYPNPLESAGQHQRAPWFGCACCPSNICRFIPSLPGYVYAVRERDVYVNLFMSNTARLDVAGKQIALSQNTAYPWCGDISLSVDSNKAGRFRMMIRIPGWVVNRPVPSDLYTYTDGKNPSWHVKINGRNAGGELENGYLAIDRNWKKGDRVEIHFDMEPRTVKADSHVVADSGRICLERGPLVYCAEWPDNKFNLPSVLLNRHPEIRVENAPGQLCGIVRLVADAQKLGYGADGRLVSEDISLTFIPYYAWAHRGPGQMAVWLPQSLNAVVPEQ